MVYCLELVSQTYTFVTLGDITVRFLPPSTWAVQLIFIIGVLFLSANLADTTWPGKAMTGPDASGYYSYTFTNIASTNIIFNRGTGTPQTADIIGVNKNTCYNMSTGTLVVETCANLGVGQIDIESSKVALYPNPVLSSFKINVDVSEVYIYDITGRIVKEFKGSFDKDTNFEISNLVNGMYFVSTKTIDGKRSTLSIVKK